MMVKTTDDEEELIVLAKETAERLRVLTLKLELYANVYPDTGDRRRHTDDGANNE